MSILSLHEVTFAYSGSNSSVLGQDILKSISLDIQAGEFVSILGPSGCGKSTLLRLIAGFLSPISGQVRISSSIQQNLSFVFQDSRLLPWLNVEENIRWGSAHLKEGKAQVEIERLKVQKALSLVRLEGKASRFPEQLSGGMKMRASFARALFRDPELMLLDEPFSALDENTKLELQIEFMKILNEKKRSCVLVTHSMTEAVLLSDRVLIMGSNGRLMDQFSISKKRNERLDWFKEASFLECVNELRDKFQKVIQK